MAAHTQMNESEVMSNDTYQSAQSPKGYDARLYNEDLAPLETKSWTSYSIFAFWMSDVHSVGGYMTCGSLFALGIASWQVLVALLVGICIVMVFCNLIAKPSQVTGTPFPVVARLAFGVYGANIPAVMRGLQSVPWYGINTWMASSSLKICLLKLFPALATYANDDEGFVGLSTLGWLCFIIMWLLQVALFWRGIEGVRKFIDLAGPAVYVAMIFMTGYLCYQAGGISFSIASEHKEGWESVHATTSAVAVVVSYFAGPMLNFGDFARYARSYKAVTRGNFWGCPVNFLGFALLTVISISATPKVFGRVIEDPVEMVGEIDSWFAAVLGAVTFSIATMGINIVANFISPSFDFSNVDPQRISMRTGGMIAATGSILVTPWNLYKNPVLIHSTLDVLSSFIGPLFGVMLAEYYLVQRQQIDVQELFSSKPTGKYWFHGGYNPIAIAVLVPSVAVPLGCVFIAEMQFLANYAWFIGTFTSFSLYSGARLLKGARRPLDGKDHGKDDIEATC